MTPSKPSLPPAHFDSFDMASLSEENDRLRRALCSVTRGFMNTKKELEAIKEANGFYMKPLPFLRLPREVRDQIYTYVLQATTNVKLESRPIYLLSLEELSWKPSTPALCLVNRQIHREASEILYSQNTFCFQNPGELLRFEEQIGSVNRDWIQRIEISTVVITQSSFVPDPDLIASCDWQGVPTHWSKGMLKSRLMNVVEMTITVENLGSSERNIVVLSPILQEAVMDFLQRSKTENKIRKLILKGFADWELGSFPLGWDVKIEQWEDDNGDRNTRGLPLYYADSMSV